MLAYKRKAQTKGANSGGQIEYTRYQRRLKDIGDMFVSQLKPLNSDFSELKFTSRKP